MANLRILLVDDFEDIHVVMKRVLTMIANDSEIHSAYQGQQAFEMAMQAAQANTPFNLIFMDMRMPPGWDGLVTSEKIAMNLPQSKIVFMSAYSDYAIEDINTALPTLQPLRFLSKPFRLHEIEAIVRLHMQ